MALAERLGTDMKAAMRGGDTRRRDVIRYLRAAIVNAAIEKRSELSDDEIQAVIRTQVKQRRDAIDFFRSGDRPELADEEEAQVEILLEYLPTPMGHDELVALVHQTADDLNAQSPRDMSRLMQALVQASAGRAEGRTLSQLAKDELARRSATGAS